MILSEGRREKDDGYPELSQTGLKAVKRNPFGVLSARSPMSPPNAGETQVLERPS